MNSTYDKYYQTEDLFGDPYPELIEFMTDYPERGMLLDLGSGQGRDAIPLARLGYEVTAIDNSMVGIEQMNRLAKAENLPLNGIVTDIYKFDDFSNYDFVLLDSMFHFQKRDKKKEIDFIKKITSKIKDGCLIIFCIQETGRKIIILNEIVDEVKQLKRLEDKKFKYFFEDKETGHTSKSGYRMIVVRKES